MTDESHHSDTETLSPEKRALLALRLTRRKADAVSAAGAVPEMESTSKIRQRAMMLSEGVLRQFVELIRDADTGLVTESGVAARLDRLRAELAVLQTRVARGEIDEAMLANAKIQIRGAICYLVDYKIQDPEVQGTLMHFVLACLFTNLLPHPKYKFTQDWFSFHSEQWEKDFGHLKGLPNLRFLEIGCFEGRSTCWLLDNILTHPTATITCVDPFVFTGHPRQEAYFDFNMAQTGVAYKVTKLRGSSQLALQFLSPESYDFIYVDGLHTIEGVMQDALLSWSLVKRGGIILFDDYELDSIFPRLVAALNPERPRPAIDAFLRLVEQRYTLIHQGWQLAIRKL